MMMTLLAPESSSTEYSFLWPTGCQNLVVSLKPLLDLKLGVGSVLDPASRRSYEGRRKNAIGESDFSIKYDNSSCTI